jgi:hypothetical protein
MTTRSLVRPARITTRKLVRLARMLRSVWRV